MFGSSKSKIKTQKLIKLNSIAAVLHFVQAVVMLSLAKDYTLPVTVSFLKFDQATKELLPATEKIMDVPLAWLTVAFLFMSAAAHLIIVTKYNKTYQENLEKGINKARWYEYSVSASTMMVGIAFLSGMYDLASLIMVFSLVAIMNLMGLVMEVWNQNQKSTNWTSFWIGCFAGIVPWIAFVIYVVAASKYATEGAGVPSFVYWIYVSIFLFFNSFAINMYLQYKKIGKWSNYLYGEKVYIILSLVAKSALAWQVFAGTLRP